jgi:hypothetical protein
MIMHPMIPRSAPRATMPRVDQSRTMAVPSKDAAVPMVNNNTTRKALFALFTPFSSNKERLDRRWRVQPVAGERHGSEFTSASHIEITKVNDLVNSHRGRSYPFSNSKGSTWMILAIRSTD